jgi:predicted enzyme related to lactoylglutathione lyase
MADPSVRGQFVWHELWTPNTAGAHEFYASVVGWRTQAWDHDPSYSLFVGPNGPLGGAMQKRAGTPQWLPYVGVTDVDAAIATVTRLGGRTHTLATDLPNGGRHAVLVDPQGAPFGIHGSKASPAPESPAAVGELSWHELATNVAPETALAFYAAVFGWDEISRFDMGPMGTYLIFGRNGAQLGGIFDKGAAGKPGAAYWLGYARVDDLDGAVERAKGARGSVLAGPMDVPGGDRIAQIMDPHGAFFALQLLAADKAAAAAKPRAKPAPAPAARAPVKAAKGTLTAKQPAKKAAGKAPKPAAKKPAPKKAAKGKSSKEKGSAKAAAPRPKKAGKAGAKAKRR